MASWLAFCAYLVAGAVTASSRHGAQDYGGTHPYELYRGAGVSGDRGLRQLSANGGDEQWQPIRIVPHFVARYLVLDDSQLTFLRDELVPAAVKQYADTLRVVPVSKGAGLLASRCNRMSSGVCVDASSQPRCGPDDTLANPQYDLKHLREERVCSSVSCGANNQCVESGCTTLPGGPGEPDADMVLYITAVREDGCSKGTITARALVCERDQFDRPTFGYINFCPDTISTAPERWRAQLTTAVHEMGHVLGFSDESFAYMRDVDNGGEPRTSREVDWPHHPMARHFVCANGETRVAERAPNSSTMLAVPVGQGGRRMVLVTPRVRREARQHFACASLLGAELEAHPTSEGACWGSHWAQRLFMMDTMGAIASVIDQRSVNSRVTLAYFEDTGWYRANYTLAETSYWGYKAGCDFVEDSLHCPWAHSTRSGKLRSYEALYGPHFCTTGSGCVVGRTAIGQCVATGLESDQCPAYRAGAGSCRDAPNAVSIGSLESFGLSSRCFVSSLQLPSASAAQEGASAGCYEHSCELDGTLRVRVSPTKWVTCPAISTVSNRDISVEGLVGTLRCPLNVSTELCLPEYLGCPNQCSGSGTCVGSVIERRVCRCLPGYSGDDCSVSVYALPSTGIKVTRWVWVMNGIVGLLLIVALRCGLPASMLKDIWAFVDDPESSPSAAFAAQFVFVLIVVSSTTVVLATESLMLKGAGVVFWIEAVCFTVFVAEMALRTLSTPDYTMYFRDVFTWIDLLAILPFYIERTFSIDMKWMTIFRILRLTRVGRIFKSSRYGTAIRVFGQSIANSSYALWMLVCLVIVACILFASAVYYAEYIEPNPCIRYATDPRTGVETDECALFENKFTSIPIGFWWCLVTMSTVGYGDYVPKTTIGKIVGAMCILTGTVVMALPITVIGSNFARVLKEDLRETIMSQIKHMDRDKDGEVDQDELQEMLEGFSDMGLFVSVDNVLVAKELMNKYDTDGNGVLDEDEMLALRADLEQRAMEMLTSNDDQYTSQMENDDDIDFGRKLNARLSLMERRFMQDMKDAMVGMVEFNNELGALGGLATVQQPVGPVRSNGISHRVNV